MKEEPRFEYSYWLKSKQIFCEGIDKNKSIPDYAKAELKEIIGEQFRLLGKIIATYEIMYLRERHSENNL